MAVDYLPADKHIYIQTENGVAGVGLNNLAEAIIPNLINAKCIIATGNARMLLF